MEAQPSPKGRIVGPSHPPRFVQILNGDCERHTPGNRPEFRNRSGVQEFDLDAHAEYLGGSSQGPQRHGLILGV